MKRLCSALVAGMLLAAWGGVPARGQEGATRWEIVVGRETDDHAIQGQAFFPMVLTVTAGDTVRWTLGGQYSHTVTFLSRQPAPMNPVVTPDGRSIINPMLEYAQGGTTYDGSRYTNSGILSAPRASTYDLTFSTPGVYPYVCMLHRGMDATVVVLPTGSQPPKTPAEYRTQGEREWTVVRDRGEGLSRSAPTVTEPVPGGAVNYYISSGFGANEASIMRFLPQELVIHVGDTVTWVQSDPQELHTVTFPDTDAPSLTSVETAPLGPPVTVLDPQATQPQGGPVHRGVGYYNSGIMQPFARYTLTFLQPGTYGYVCIPHASLGQFGTIVVQPQ